MEIYVLQSKVNHIFEPIYDNNSKILILGTMPSPKSRENGFYYMHPLNRFWPVISTVLCQPLPIAIDDKLKFLYENNIALWDVLKSCDIIGASDNSIKNPVANDINIILSNADIKAIFTTGIKAYTLYNRLCLPHTNYTAIQLPSTSPANCRMNIAELIDKYKIIKEYL